MTQKTSEWPRKSCKLYENRSRRTKCFSNEEGWRRGQSDLFFKTARPQLRGNRSLTPTFPLNESKAVSAEVFQTCAAPIVASVSRNRSLTAFAHCRLREATAFRIAPRAAKPIAPGGREALHRSPGRTSQSFPDRPDRDREQTVAESDAGFPVIEDDAFHETVTGVFPEVPETLKIARSDG